MEVIFGVLALVALVVVLILFARTHSRREQEALSALGEMVHERKARHDDRESLVP